jgi:hypothetical protein
MFCFYVFQGGPISNDTFSVFFPSSACAVPCNSQRAHKSQRFVAVCLAGRQTSDSKITLMVEEIRATLLSYSL